MERQGGHIVAVGRVGVMVLGPAVNFQQIIPGPAGLEVR